MIVLLCRFLHLPIDDPGDCNDTIAKPVNGQGDCNDSITLQGFTYALHCNDSITWPVVLPCKFLHQLLHQPIDDPGDCTETIAWPVNGPGDCNDSITLKGFTSAY